MQLKQSQPVQIPPETNPNMRWFMCHVPPTARRSPWGEWWEWDLKRKGYSQTPFQSKHENTHMRNTQRKFSLDIRHVEKKKHSTHMSWTPMRYDHKALISISVSKENHAFPIRWRLGDEGFMSKCYNIKSSLFFFFSPQWPDYPLTLDTYWTFNGPHTDTDTTTIVIIIIILTLTCSETSHPLLGMITLRNHPALAPTPRAQVCERTGRYLTVRQEHLRWVGCAFIDICFPSMDRKCTLTLWSELPAVYLLSVSHFTQKFERFLIILHVNKPDFI